MFCEILGFEKFNSNFICNLQYIADLPSRSCARWRPQVFFVRASRYLYSGTLYLIRYTSIYRITAATKLSTKVCLMMILERA